MLKDFLAGQLNLEDLAFQRLGRDLAAKISDGVDRTLLETDLDILQPLYDQTGLKIRAPDVKASEALRDAALLRSLNLDPNRHLGEEEGERVYGLIGGFWFAIRFSTAGESRSSPEQSPYQAPYNVSLLTVHSLSYLDVVSEAKPRPIRTVVPHFTLRSRSEQQSDLRIYDGRVINLGFENHLIGTRDDRTKLIRLSLRDPNNKRRFELDPSIKIRETQGIITTASSSGATITGPVVACEIPLTARMREIQSAPGEEASSVELSRLFLERRMELEKNVKAFARETLTSELGKFCGETVLRDALETLHRAREVAKERKGGNYYVPLTG